MKVSRLIFCFLFASSNILFSQDRILQFKHLSVNEGLSGSNVLSIMQDHNGFIWLGTPSGLDKFDGTRFTPYKHDPADSGSISGNGVNDILEDRQGNIWVATYRGLNLFDRKKNTFTSFKHDEKNTQTISGNTTQCLLIDSKDNFWVGTINGFNRFDRKTRTFDRYIHHSDDTTSISENDVSSIAEDSEGRLWIGTRGGGLNRFDPVSKSFVHYRHNPDDKNSLGNDFVLSLFEDSKKNFWVGTNKGLYRFDRDNNTFTRYIDDSIITHNVIVCMAEDAGGNLWVGTENDGLYIYDSQKNTFQNLRHNSSPASLSNNSIYSFCRDITNNMWVGTYSGGVDVFDANSKKFIPYGNIPNNENSLSNNSVLSFAEAGDDSIWIATDGGGLNLFDEKQNRFTHYKADPKNPNAISGDYIASLLIDENKSVWAAVWGGGADFYSVKDKTFTHHRHNPKDPSSISSDYCYEIYQDRKGDIWVGTLGGGMSLLNEDRQTFTRYLPDASNKEAIGSKLIFAIFEDSRNNFWVGTEDAGLSMLDRKTNTFVHYRHEDNNPRSISNNTVNVILEDKSGNLWLGTNGGLNKFDYFSRTFSVYLEKDGLISDAILSIEVDDLGNLWIGTIKGISKFNPETEQFRNYTVDDGLQSSEFNRQASLRAKNGKMYFGGIHGFNSFYPDSITDNTFLPPVVITDFLVFNKPLEIGKEDSLLKAHISETKELTLSYEHSVFTIEFTSLEYINPQKSTYAYMLENFDKTWNYIGNKRSATYTHLDPGVYYFKVKASNNDGIWNEHAATLKITITPPFWKTWWFRVAMALVLGGGMYLIFTGRLRAVEKQKTILEKKVQEKTAEIMAQKEALEIQANDLNAMNEEQQAQTEILVKQKEVIELQNDLLTASKIELEKNVKERTAELSLANKQLVEHNMQLEQFAFMTAHNLRSPVARLIGLSNIFNFHDPADQFNKEVIMKIQTSAKDLDEVISDISTILQIKKSLKENFGKVNVQSILQYVLHALRAEIENKKIEIVNKISPSLSVVGIAAYVNSVFYNIVSNSIKYADLRKSPKIIIEEGVRSGETVTLNFIDNGIGFDSENKREKLFKPFTRLNTHTEGKGLGLYLVKIEMDSMRGSIEIESKPGVGTKATLCFNKSDISLAEV
jgi:ligand-binding sensor domain-containing protein/signal transduction histidine kinase